MRKIIILLILSIILVGCKDSKAVNNAQDSMYTAYYSAIKDNANYLNKSTYFNLSAQLSELPDGTYLYYVFVDEPHVAMYDVRSMVMPTTYKMPIVNDYTLPTVGILDSVVVNLIPNQVNAELGYQKGVVLSGVCDSQEVILDMAITWNNEKKTDYFREFYRISVNLNGYEIVNVKKSGEINE